MHRLPRLLFVLCFVVFYSSEACSQFLFDRVAITGEPTAVQIPDSEPSVMTFASLSNPIINDLGESAFAGSIVGAPGSESGIWSQAFPSALLSAVAKEDLPVRLSDPKTIFGDASGGSTFGPLKLEQGRYPTFRARLMGSNVNQANDSAVYRWTGQVPVEFFREGDRTTGGAGTTVGDLFLLPDTVQETVLRRLPTIGGAPPNDTAIHTPFAYYSEGNVVRGDLGDLTEVRPIRATTTQAVIRAPRGTLGEQAIFEIESGNADELVFEGHRPSNAPAVELTAFNHPIAVYSDETRSDRYRTVFGATLSGQDVGPQNDSAILSTRSVSQSSLFLIVREGMQVPGRPAGVTLGSLATDNLVGGANGHFLFNSQLVGPGIGETNDWAIVGWTDLTSNGAVLAQEGEFVPGLPSGAQLVGLNAPHFQLNLNGDAIFNAQFMSPSGDGLGLFYANVDGSDPQLIVRTGQDFDIGGGIFKTISDIGLLEMATPWDGRGAQINDAGQVVFNLSFTDGSQGVFTTVIPEPGTLTLACSGCLLMTFVAVRRLRKGVRQTPQHVSN
jgi:hypothetical protein